MKKSAFAKTLIGAGVLSWFVYLAWSETKRPLRKPVENKFSRLGRNLAIAGLGAGALQVLEQPLVIPLSKFVGSHRLGLLRLFPIPKFTYLIASVCLMDYTLYLWHVLTHKAPFLWRFHVVHHIDLDLDASTAIRFHFAELGISVLWRVLQILILGINFEALMAWQTFLIICILFHHSNVRLPISLERKLNCLLVTPRMHAIHHSTVESETNSNWSSGLTVWDKLHKTYQMGWANTIEIGVPAYQAKTEVGLIEMIALPFTRQRVSWPSPNLILTIKRPLL